MFAEIGCAAAHAAWATIDDVCDDVRTVLGSDRVCYDIRAIAAECYEWVDGRMVATDTWLCQDDFWACVMEHTLCDSDACPLGIPSIGCSDAPNGPACYDDFVLADDAYSCRVFSRVHAASVLAYLSLKKLSFVPYYFTICDDVPYCLYVRFAFRDDMTPTRFASLVAQVMAPSGVRHYPDFDSRDAFRSWILSRCSGYFYAPSYSPREFSAGQYRRQLDNFFGGEF